MTAKIFPRFQQLSDFSIININRDDDEQREIEAQEIERRGVEAFLAAHPEYFQCDENDKLLEAWLFLHGDLPFTLWNLEIALRDLQEDGILQAAPPPEQPSVDKWASVTLARTDTLAEYVPSGIETVTLARVRDDSTLNDHQRKARDRKLALLARKQRREFAGQRCPDDRDPQIVI